MLLVRFIKTEVILKGSIVTIDHLVETYREYVRSQNISCSVFPSFVLRKLSNTFGRDLLYDKIPSGHPGYYIVYSSKIDFPESEKISYFQQLEAHDTNIAIRRAAFILREEIVALPQGDFTTIPPLLRSFLNSLFFGPQYEDCQELETRMQAIAADIILSISGGNSTNETHPVETF